MRFKLCGGNDAPEWILKEIVVLSEISAVRFKLLVIVMLRHLLGGKLELQKIRKYLSIMEGVGISEEKAILAAISYILSNAAKYKVSTEDVALELQQLGLPREHTMMMKRPLVKYIHLLTKRLRSKVLRINPIDDPIKWRLDYIVSNNNLRNVNQFQVTLKLSDDVSFMVNRDQVSVLLHELRQASALISQIDE